MLPVEQRRIRERTAALVLEWADDRHPPFTGETVEEFGDAVVIAHLVADEARLNLHRRIDAARRAGLSWTAIGEALGISKQAAQQRFRGVDRPDEPDADGDVIVRLGATAFNEMGILREEGLRGRELIGIGALRLVFRPTDDVWEYCRRIGSLAMVTGMALDGWQYVSGWTPFHYFKRAVPAE